MDSQRFARPVTITQHARGQMATRNITEALLLDIIETGEHRQRDAIHGWIAKAYADRADNMLCAAVALDRDAPLRVDRAIGERTMRTTYYPQDDILEIHFSEKPIVREVSQDWNVNVSFAADGSIVQLVILDAVKTGFMPFGSGKNRAAA